MQTGEEAGGGWGVKIYMMSLVSVGLSYILYKCINITAFTVDYIY